jgi:transcription initiation factor IIE alpha subunit
MEKYMTKIAKVLEAFENGEELTGKQIVARFGVANYRAVVHTLRNEGYAIYLNKRTDTKGRVKMKYRLGKPTRAVVAAGIAALGLEGARLV